ncbi:hypothetical protein [Pengzhenrongella sicca]|uniref:Uncharacterized protein n=1 Tax=Pengzhenrongella sicca TaxID=2819238 RepID=A0A8A4ZHW3_9MICO|nr:hypothetical protein [Pengzhenrongella sicca]QTE30855.1 hypothetical protein J4E96_07980 [Pengzhenrongella sicca]
MRRSTIATIGIFASPAILAGSALLAVTAWTAITHELVCLDAPTPVDPQVIGEGTLDGQRTWILVGERCTWATASGETVTTTNYDLAASIGLLGGVAATLTSAVVFVISARSGADDRPAWKHRTAA